MTLLILGDQDETPPPPMFRRPARKRRARFLVRCFCGWLSLFGETSSLFLKNREIARNQLISPVVPEQETRCQRSKAPISLSFPCFWVFGYRDGFAPDYEHRHLTCFPLADRALAGKIAVFPRLIRMTGYGEARF